MQNYYNTSTLNCCNITQEQNTECWGYTPYRNLGSIYSRNVQPFDQPFRLSINLGVGPLGEDFFSLSLSNKKKFNDWKCLLLIIDYAKIYKWVDGYENLSTKSIL
jgi:hypothetical protein